MEKYLRNHGHHVDSEKDADKIKMCVNLLNRLIDDNYYDMVFKKHNKKWGEPKFNCVDIKNKANCSELKIVRSNVVTKEDEKKENNEYRNLMQTENDLRQQDIDYLFETIRKYHQKWWD